ALAAEHPGGRLPGPRRPGLTGPALLRVGTAGVELDADDPQLLGGRPRSCAEVGGDLQLPADRLADLLDRRAGMERIEPHLAIVIEVIDAEVVLDDRWAPPEQTLLAFISGVRLGPDVVSAASPEVGPTDEVAEDM